MAWRKPKDFRDWIRTIFRHKKKFFFPAVAVMILVFLASQKVPRVYTAEAVFARQNNPALMQMGSRTLDINIAAFHKSLNEDIKGRAAIEQLIDDLKLTQDLPHLPGSGELTAPGEVAKTDLIRQIQNHISISYEVSSDNLDQIRITYSDTKRELAPRIANQIVESYISNTRRQLNMYLEANQSFFDKEVTRSNDRVTTLTQKKLAFLADNTGFQPDDPASMQNKITSVQAALDQAKSDLALARGKAAALAEYIKQQPEMISGDSKIENPEMAALVKAKIDLEQQESVLLLTKTALHPDVIKIKKQLADIVEKIKHTQAQVQGDTQTQPNVARIAAEEHLQTLEGEIGAMTRDVGEKTRELDKYQNDMGNFYVLRSQYESILRDLSEAASRLKFFDDNLRSATLALTTEASEQGVRLRLVQRADDFVRPSSPTLVSIIGAALVLGLGVGGLLVLISELLDHSFRNVEHAVDDLKLPVLGTVNEIVTPQEAFRRKVLNTSFYPAIGAVMVLILMASIVLAYMSLEMPDRFDLLTTHPTRYFGDTFLPGGR